MTDTATQASTAATADEILAASKRIDQALADLAKAWRGREAAVTALARASNYVPRERYAEIMAIVAALKDPNVIDRAAAEAGLKGVLAVADAVPEGSAQSVHDHDRRQLSNILSEKSK